LNFSILFAGLLSLAVLTLIGSDLADDILIGGGKDLEKTCMILIVDGDIVRVATGPNDRPGGSETLAPDSWDVGEFIGRTAVIQIVDMATGGWGRINVDHTVQTDRKPPGQSVKAAIATAREPPEPWGVESAGGDCLRRPGIGSND
jgi:hypothetical protein